MAVPVWITDEAGSISYMNARAEGFFGHSLTEWSGRPCHKCVRGRGEDGAVCSPRCKVRTDAAVGRDVRPVRMFVTARPTRREVNILMIVVDGLVGRRFVHCVVDDERERRMQRFLDGVIHRSEPRAARLVVQGTALTAREEEVLALLAEDFSLHQIAERLAVSYTTVRNHVQHILPKLGVHSILEAAALWMIGTKVTTRVTPDATRDP